MGGGWQVEGKVAGGVGGSGDGRRSFSLNEDQGGYRGASCGIRDNPFDTLRLLRDQWHAEHEWDDRDAGAQTE